MVSCSKCGHEHPKGGGFCTNCGAPAAGALEGGGAVEEPRAAKSGGAVEEPSICAGCGVAVDASRQSCETCDARYPSPPLRALAQPGSGYWVAVRAEFTCNACRFKAPINHFELGDGVVCTRCGIEQRYGVRQWETLVDFAHEVGDFGAPGDQGRFPELPVGGTKPHARIGVRASWAKHEDLRYRASPGNPLCEACKAPVVVTERSGARLAVACSACGDRRAYETPASAQAWSLAGVCAGEHEADRRDVTVVESAGGVVALQCPNCSAPLTSVADDKGVFTCGFCNVPCRISTRTHARAGNKGVPQKTWWLYFDTPSKAREKARQRAEGERRKQQEKEKRRLEQEEARRRNDREHAARVEKQREREKKDERRAALPLLLVFASVPFIATAIFLPEYLKKKEKAEATLAEEESRPSEAKLLEYSFSMTDQEASELFGQEVKPGEPVKFKPPAVFEEAKLNGTNRAHAVDLKGGSKFNANAFAERLAKLVPLRGLYNQNYDPELGWIRISTHYTGSVDVAVNVKGERAAEVADAFFAAVRWAALDGPELSPAQLRIVQGPTLADVASVDASAPGARASAAVTEKLPFATCRTVTNLLTQKTELTCATQVYDRLFTKVTYSWDNAPTALLRSVTLQRYTPGPYRGSVPAADPTACLTGALGPGKEEVVDLATGRTALTWSAGKGKDPIVLDGNTVTFQTSDSAPATQPAGWAPDLPKVLGALSTCTL